MSEMGRIEAASAAGSRAAETVRAQAPGERFSPLLTREAHTFARMRIDSKGPRAYSAICFPGWKRAE